MMSDFLDVGIKTIVITEPYITEYCINYQPAIANGYLAFTNSGQSYILSNWWSCGCNAGLLDITNPAARQWWWDKHPAFFGSELSGIWTDLGEPENHPEGMNHFLGSRNKIHNIYNLLWAETIFEGFSQFKPNQRIFNLTRSGYAGIQRYGVIPWSGDVGKDFGGLAVQLPMVLNMGMSGLAYHNSDIGGFCCGFTTPELYVRWMQYGTFCPITRAHGVGQPTEPWSYGNEAEAINKKYLRLRYKLLPYIYTLAYENYKSGMPLLRPLFFSYPDDELLINNSASYLFGDKLLVSPVVTGGTQTKNIYLPEGNWIYFWDDVFYQGGQNYTVDTPIDIMPVFVKAGSIVPMAPLMNFTDELPADTLILNIYPSDNLTAEFTLYEDDGLTLDYQIGNFAETYFEQSLSNQTLSIFIGQSIGSFSGKVNERTYLSEVHLIAGVPSSVYKNGSELIIRNSYPDLRNNPEGYYYDHQKHLLYIQIICSTDSSYLIIAENVALGNVKYQSAVPNSFALSQNFPNPFNSSTRIIFKIGEDGEVTLKVYDILGREIMVLVNEYKTAGTYEVSFNAGSLSSGVYYYQLAAGSFLQTRKLTFLK
jgi:alpha-glucosidase (family GH31 glycosyl hydrolase)